MVKCSDVTNIRPPPPSEQLFFARLRYMWVVQVMSSFIEIEIYNNGKTHRLLKLLYFIYECAGILLTSIYVCINTQRVLATPTLIGT